MALWRTSRSALERAGGRLPEYGAPRRRGDKLRRHDVGGRRRPQQRPGAVRVYAAGRRVPGAAHRLIAGDKQKSRRTKAIAALSTLVGAVSMARAVNDEKLSREILKSAADELKARLG